MTTKKRAPFKKKEGPKDIDLLVGTKLKEQRLSLRMTQEDLARETGVTFQQIQKYESGKNRTSASRLYQFCQILNVTPNYFFEETVK